MIHLLFCHLKIRVFPTNPENNASNDQSHNMKNKESQLTLFCKKKLIVCYLLDQTV